MPAGYSGTPLIKKLGIKETDRVQLVNAPAAYYKWIEKDLAAQLCSKKEKPDFVHLFVKDIKSFESAMQKILSQIKPTTVTWVSWYKKSSGIPTDITETHIRDYALKNSLVDVKVCAVTDEWSGLKLVVPVAKRKTI
ncbi:MAG: hypothetical protein QM791_06905 [Ferruginibacter sp.]